MSISGKPPNALGGVAGVTVDEGLGLRFAGSIPPTSELAAAEADGWHLHVAAETETAETLP